ncbi:MAG: serine/threonine protein kinase [Planctomycetes bacterium]|nr:serine/threonine protein kinase [Planctomycetota bacterium]
MRVCLVCGKTFQETPGPGEPACSHCGSAQVCPVPLDNRAQRPGGIAEAGRHDGMEKTATPIQKFLVSRGVHTTIDLPAAELGRKKEDSIPIADLVSPPAGGAIPTPATSLPSGGSTGARYEIISSIGAGGMGEVLLSRDRDIRRPVAMKVVREQAASQAVVARFVEEAQFTGQLEHPNIVPVHELGLRADGRLFFTMKLVQGRNLGDIVEELKAGKGESGRRWTLSERVLVFLKVLDAVAFAHSRGVIHRDLKPSNIMIGEFGEVYVMDWGLAKIVGPRADLPGESPPAGAPASTPREGPTIRLQAPDAPADGLSSRLSSLREDFNVQLTQQGQLVGTPAYMSPEQAAGEHASVDARSDIYSLGATLYEWITLERPVEGQSLNEILVQIDRGEVIPPRRRRPDLNIPKDLDAVIQKAMARRQADRYTSVQEFASDLRVFLADEPVKARRPDLREQFFRWARRHRQVLLPVGVSWWSCPSLAPWSSSFAARSVNRATVRTWRRRKSRSPL